MKLEPCRCREELKVAEIELTFWTLIATWSPTNESLLSFFFLLLLLWVWIFIRLQCVEMKKTIKKVHEIFLNKILESTTIMSYQWPIWRNRDKNLSVNNLFIFTRHLCKWEKHSMHAKTRYSKLGTLIINLKTNFQQLLDSDPRPLSRGVDRSIPWATSVLLWNFFYK